MSTVRSWLEAAEDLLGERIEAISIAGLVDGTALSRERGLSLLEDEFEAAENSEAWGCRPMYAWTASRVFFVQEHDGALRLAFVPRVPTTGVPQISGSDPAQLDHFDREEAERSRNASRGQQARGGV